MPIEEGDVFRLKLKTGTYKVRMVKYLNATTALIEWVTGPDKGKREIIGKVPG